MSRTRKGRKDPTHEYWSRRSGFREPGRWSKTMTHRLERRQGKGQSREGR